MNLCVRGYSPLEHVTKYKRCTYNVLMPLGKSVGTVVRFLLEQSSVVESRHTHSPRHFVELDVLIAFTFINVSKQIATSTLGNNIPRTTVKKNSKIQSKKFQSSRALNEHDLMIVHLSTTAY